MTSTSNISTSNISTSNISTSTSNISNATTQMTPFTTGFVHKLNAEHRACEEAMRAGLVHALECGRMLASARCAVGHGGWGAWLTEHFEGSDRTARLYLRLHSRREALIQNGSALPISVRRATKMIADPAKDVKPEQIEDEEVEQKVERAEPKPPLTFDDAMEKLRASIERVVESAEPRARPVLGNVLKAWGEETAETGGFLGQMLPEPAETGEVMAEDPHDIMQAVCRKAREVFDVLPAHHRVTFTLQLKTLIDGLDYDLEQQRDRGTKGGAA